MQNKKTHIHSVEKLGALESAFRYRFQNPTKIVGPYIKPGMTVLDLGCGPGFFTTEIARLLHRTGKVIAADIQNGMLDKVVQKISGTDFEGIVQIHKCQEKCINLTEEIDFVLAFYSFHEMSSLEKIIDEIKVLLKPDGKILIAEQKFHVRKEAFREIIDLMKIKGFRVIGTPKVFLSRAVLMEICCT